MVEEDLESLLEDVGRQKELAVRRYLSELTDFLEQELDERPDKAVGGISFNPGKISKKDMSGKFGVVANFLAENTEYVNSFTNYHIEPESLEELRDEAENIELYPTIEEEQEMIKGILDGRDMRIEEIKDEVDERLDYEPRKSMVQQRVDKIDEVESEKGEYYLEK